MCPILALIHPALTQRDLIKEDRLRQQNRQPATKDAVLRRLRDAELEQLPDRRGRRGRRYPYLGLVMALALGAVAALRSLREVEALTAGLRPAVRRRSRITRRYNDTKLRDTLLRLHPEETRVAIHRQVKAEHRRGNLKPTRLPFVVVAIDGKGLGKLDQWDHPDVQPVRPEERSPCLEGRRPSNTVDPSPAGCLCTQRSADDCLEHPGCSPTAKPPGVHVEAGSLARSRTFGALRAGRTGHCSE